MKPRKGVTPTAWKTIANPASLAFGYWCWCISSRPWIIMVNFYKG